MATETTTAKTGDVLEMSTAEKIVHLEAAAKATREVRMHVRYRAIKGSTKC